MTILFASPFEGVSAICITLLLGIQAAKVLRTTVKRSIGKKPRSSSSLNRGERPRLHQVKACMARSRHNDDFDDHRTTTLFVWSLPGHAPVRTCPGLKGGLLWRLGCSTRQCNPFVPHNALDEGVPQIHPRKEVQAQTSRSSNQCINTKSSDKEKKVIS